MLRIFLTGDNHIGLKYANYKQASFLANNRIETFKSMVDAANREKCDLFVIAGDLFENTYSIAKKSIQTLLKYLSGFKGTVAILPGNHDYYDREVRLWQDFKYILDDYDNIILLTEDESYETEVFDKTVILYPALCTAKHSEPGKNNLDWIKKKKIVPDSTYRIGIAHGAVEGEAIDKEGKYYVMTRTELDSIPVDIWLIGHTHVPFPRNLSEEYTAVKEKVFNAGTHVQRDYNNNTEGLCFILEIAENKSIRAKKFIPGDLRFYRRNITLEPEKMEEILQRELADINNKSVVDIILNGAVTIEEYDNRIQIIKDILSRFLESDYNDNELIKRITKDIIDSEFPETSFSARLLTALLDEPKEAQLAYELLKTLEGK